MMIPGRELDALISSKVLGIDTVKIEGKGRQTLFQDGFGKSIPRYSESIEAAWLVVEKLNFILAPQYVPGPGDRPRNGWAVYGKVQDLYEDVYSWPGDKMALAVAETAPHAICLAALAIG